MDSTIYTSLKKCFNTTFTGWRNKNERIRYQQKLLDEYPVIGGEAFCAFSKVMEMCDNPHEFLSMYFEFMKKMQSCVDKNNLTGDQFISFFDEAKEMTNKFLCRYKGEPDKQTAITGIAVTILKCYEKMIREEEAKKAS